MSCTVELARFPAGQTPADGASPQVGARGTADLGPKARRGLSFSRLQGDGRAEAFPPSGQQGAPGSRPPAQNPAGGGVTEAPNPSLGAGRGENALGR